MKVILCQGLPASGKSSWAREFVQKNKGWIRINRDDLRAMLHNSVWSPENEKVVVEVQENMIALALWEGKNIIIDDTNFGSNIERITRHIKELPSECPQPEIEVKRFDITLSEALKRNAQRANAVPEKVIKDMYRRYIEPNRSIVRGVYRAPNPDLPECVIFDLDGTLSIPHPERDPRRDCSTCDKDGPNFPILRLAHLIRNTGLPILCVSGREDGPGRAPTERWLKYYDVPAAELHMRKTKDYRKDSIVKREIFETEIAPRWNVVWVFDDRDQVVSCWRELGLCCLQVADGDF